MAVRKDNSYKCLNPVGIQVPVDLSPLAKRLDTIDGKEIYISICGEPDITIPLEKQLKTNYPNVNWRVKKSYMTHPIPMTDEEVKTADGVIQGVAW